MVETFIVEHLLQQMVDGERAAARSKDRLEPLYRPLIARACRNRTACAQHV